MSSSAKKALVCALVGIAPVFSTLAQVRDYPRDLFNTPSDVTGALPFPDYNPRRLDDLISKRFEADLQMFDLINEAAVRRDPRVKYYLALYRRDLGPAARLAAAHYNWAFGDKSQLDWLLTQAKDKIGKDNLVVLVFGYMNEWGKTIQWLKRDKRYADAHLNGGAAGEILSRAIEIRRRLYGESEFDAAWSAAK